MIGQTISHYKILEKLGGGGMGVVYKAEDTKLKRLVALKFLPAEFTSDPAARERFVHEAQAASALDHPNICTIYEIGETEDGQSFIALAYYRGETLKKKIERGPLKLDEATDIASQIAQGLARAHEAGIVHRDIKPANVMMTDRNEVKIVDFGLAKLTGRTQLTKTGSTVGTVAYLSPELARGEKADHRTDIWSLGVVLYEMITGQLPFKSEYHDAVVYSILNEDPIPVTGVRTGVPVELERIISKCMEKKATDRYQHMDELIVDLRKVREKAGSEVVAHKKRLKPVWIAVPAVLLALIGVYLLLPFKAETINTKSIAVLPLKNMSDSKEDEYFSDGVTEDIITQLSKIRELNVISRTTMMQYKGTMKSLRDIAKELNVGVILEGSVRRAGDQIRIVAQLIDGQTDRHLWAETYDKEYKQVFAIQSEIAQKIAAALETKLASKEKDRLRASTTSNTETYSLLLQGRYFLARRDRESISKSIDLFQQALAIDPDDAHVWAALAGAYSTQAGVGYVRTEVGFAKAREAAGKAISLNNILADGYIEMGKIKKVYDWDWEGADADFRNALELQPGNADALRYAGDLAATVGRFDDAIRLSRKAVELNPTSAPIYRALGFHLMYANRLEEAVTELSKALDLNPQYITGHLVLGRVYLLQGKIDSAVAEMQKEPEEFWRLFGLALAYYDAGRKREADVVLKELIQKYRDVGAWQIAEVYAYRGDADNAFKWLEDAYNKRDSGLPQMKGDPCLKKIEGDPRYAAFLKKMKLPL